MGFAQPLFCSIRVPQLEEHPRTIQPQPYLSNNCSTLTSMNPSNNCDVPGCIATASRRHGWRYHSVPVPFTIGERQYIVSTAANQYGCPFDACGRFFKTREAIQDHMKDAHNGGVTIHILDYYQGQGELNGISRIREGGILTKTDRLCDATWNLRHLSAGSGSSNAISSGHDSSNAISSDNGSSW
jgi:hypothetical protein